MFRKKLTLRYLIIFLHYAEERQVTLTFIAIAVKSPKQVSEIGVRCSSLVIESVAAAECTVPLPMMESDNERVKERNGASR